MPKKKKSWIWQHRSGIRRVATGAGLVGGGAIGLGTALTFRFAGAGSFFVYPSAGIGAIVASRASRKFTGHFKPHKTKSAFKVATKPAFKSPFKISKPTTQRSIFQFG